MIKKYIRTRLQNSGISRIVIQRSSNRVDVTIHTSKPGMVIGKSGAQVNQLRDELQHVTGKEVFLDIKSIDNPDLDARLVGENIARQLEMRVSFRRAMKKAISSAIRSGAKGIKVRCSGRLGGADMARKQPVTPSGSPGGFVTRYLRVISACSAGPQRGQLRRFSEPATVLPR